LRALLGLLELALFQTSAPSLLAKLTQNYRPSDDFISLPRFQDFKSAAHFYGTAFHELGHNAEPSVMPRRSGSRAKRDQTGVAMRHNQSDSRSASKGLRDDID
jgi:antirestriction protein ArdC